jgi:hypothetical protein
MELKELIELAQNELIQTSYSGKEPRIISYEVNLKGDKRIIVEYNLEFLIDKNEPSGWKYSKVSSTVYTPSDI